MPQQRKRFHPKIKVMQISFALFLSTRDTQPIKIIQAAPGHKNQHKTRKASQKIYINLEKRKKAGMNLWLVGWCLSMLKAIYSGMEMGMGFGLGVFWRVISIRSLA